MGPKIYFAKMQFGRHLVKLALWEEIRWNYFFICRPKKSVQDSPLLPTRQSLRLQKKNPEGLPSLETRSQASSPPVDERVNSFKVRLSKTRNLSLEVFQCDYEVDLFVVIIMNYQRDWVCHALWSIISSLPNKIFWQIGYKCGDKYSLSLVQLFFSNGR